MFDNKFVQIIGGLLISLVLLLMLTKNITSILNYKKGLNRIDIANEKYDKTVKENEDLKSKIAEAEDPEYKKKLAIEELNLVSDDATILIISDETTPSTPSGTESHSNNVPVGNLKKWANYLNF